MSDNPYRPIACGLHESYQYAVMTRTRLDLNWRDESGQHHQARVLPIDVVTRDKAEYLVVRGPSGETLAVRLDRIDGAIDLASGKNLE
ncbi:MAG: transcriptional antiterminator, Rof [Candidatus Thiodiazotropha sp. (ex. Lucinisca nassula)]|nr:transcriptional antiterminator, Rof [Candidatus Thiodiazotropha sp. (ex. Lucinisca nassula)]MBW9260201.1 transcriptional antiterminator, Rof [Candidatus Thiodiazotropha sp. (ex. Lucinisca nassula)]MBW9271523.1 transcriptional antiterminator, Rof [Candidatus Thiodiazotropha sp. (ex. Lucinisca nassula)]